MRKNFIKSTIILILLVLVLILPEAAYASTTCSGTLIGTYDNVIVDGGACTLDGAIVRGSVLVRNGGTLTAIGSTVVAGDVRADSGGNILLDQVTVLGDVTLTGSGDVTVGAAANIAALLVNSSGSVNASGSLASIQASASGGIRLDGATVFPGSVEMVNGTGSLVICGSTVEGIVNVVSTTGDVLVEESAACGASKIDYDCRHKGNR